MEWLVWYGLRIGFSYSEVLDMPFVILCNYIAIEMFKTEGARVRETDGRSEEEKFDYFMSFD